MVDVKKNEKSILEDRATLLIGLGGAGGQVVARVKGTIENSFGAESVKAKNVHYLVFDNDDFSHMEGPPREYLNESKEFVCLSGFNPREAYMAYERRPENMADLRAWFPKDDVDLLPNKVENTGAARCRPRGRFFVYHNREKARQALFDLVNRALTGVPDARNLRVIFTHSCLGGSGSSALLDILYILKLVMQEKGNINGEFYDYVMLPEMFLNNAIKQQPALEDYLKANAFAFFRELDYIQKNPDKLNEWAFDCRSEGRTQPARGLNPRQPVPFDMIYLIDSVIPSGSIGQFGGFSDLFDYTRMCIYYTLFCESVYNKFNSRICDAEGTLQGQKDSTWNRSLRYSAVGVSEIRYPRELLGDWYQLRAFRDLVGILLGKESHPAKMVEDAYLELQNSIPVFHELEKKMKDVIDKCCKLLPKVDAYVSPDNKVDWNQANISNFKGSLASACVQVDNSRKEINKVFVEYLMGARETFYNALLSFMKTWGNDRGILFCKQVLDRYNYYLESQVPVYIKEGRNANLKAIRLKEEIDIAITEISKPFYGDGKNSTKISELIDQLEKYVRVALSETTNQWLGELTRNCAGDPQGKDPILLRVDPKTGIAASDTTSTRSILDTLVDEVDRKIVTLYKLRNWDIHTEFQRQLQKQGRSPSSLYIPDLSMHENLESPLVIEPYEQVFPAFSPKSSPEVQAKMLNNIRKDNDVLQDFVKFTSIGEDDFKKLLLTVSDKLVQMLSLQKKQDIVALLGADFDKHVKSLNLHSTPVLRYTEEKITNAEDRKRIQRKVFLGAENNKTLEMAHQYAEMSDNCDFIMDEGIVQIRLVSIIPYMISDSLRNLQNSYIYRQEKNRPHISSQLNLGELDIQDPLDTERLDPFQIYLKMWALTALIDEAKMGNESAIAWRDILFNRFQIDLPKCNFLKITPTFFYYVIQENATNFGLNAVNWQEINGCIALDEIKPYVHISRAVTYNWCISRKYNFNLYLKNHDLIKNHESILFVIDRDDPSHVDSLLHVLYQSLILYLKKSKESYMNLRASGEYNIAFQKEADNRSMTDCELTLLENDKFVFRMIRVLEHLVQRYEKTVHPAFSLV